MKHLKHHSAILPLLTLVFFAVSSPASASMMKWPVKIVPANSCTVQWTSDFGQSGTLTKSGTALFDFYSNLTFTITAQPGFKLTHVYKNTDDQIAYLKGGKISFGPVKKTHTLTVVCEMLNPVGDFSGIYDDAKGVTSIVDITGNYKGTVPDEGPIGGLNTGGRAYNVDVAMDESGKLSSMGTVTGVANAQGGAQISGGSGSVKTVNNKPNALLKGSFKGSVDGEQVSGSGKAQGDAVIDSGGSSGSLLTLSAGTPEVSGMVSGSGKVGKERYAAKPTEASVELTPQQVNNLKKNWGLSLKLDEKQDAKGKNYVEASGELRLSNGEYSRFGPQKVKYSATKGYSIRFSKGRKLDSAKNPVLDKKGQPVIDRKSTVTISEMGFTGNPGSWTPIKGNLSYQFLGQKGRGNLAEFLDTDI